MCDKSREKTFFESDKVKHRTVQFTDLPIVLKKLINIPKIQFIETFGSYKW